MSEATWPRDPALRPALRSDVAEGRLLGVLVAGAEAADFPCPPMAKVAIPATVPNGLHANWFSRRR